MNFDERVKLSPVEGETTHLNDFRIPPLEPYVRYRWPADRVEKPDLPPPPPQSYTCPESLTKLRADKYVPMNLTWKFRPAVDPLPDICNTSGENVDRKKEEAIRTRPRVYMSSAVSIDDVDDPEVRNLLLSYMYTTDFKRAFKEAQDYKLQQMQKNDMKEGCETVSPITIPCVIKDEGVPRLPSSTLPTLPKDDRQHFQAWDAKQMRATVDPTVKYWTRFYENRVSDKPITSMIPPETVARVTTLIENDKTRLAHDKPMCGYCGYVPNMTTIDIEKIELPLTHPMHTTNDTVYVNHWDHANNNYEK